MKGSAQGQGCCYGRLRRPGRNCTGLQQRGGGSGWLGGGKRSFLEDFQINLCRIHPPGTPAGGTKYKTGQKRLLYRSRMMSVRGESGLVGKLVKKPVDQD